LVSTVSLAGENILSITVLVEWQVKSQELSTTKALLQETFVSTLNFEGCQRYEVYENQDSPGDIVLLTQWNTRNQYTQYMEWRKETGILGQFGKTFANPPKIRYFESIS
jgi:quinol monooxygenase YgiN